MRRFLTNAWLHPRIRPRARHLGAYVRAVPAVLLISAVLTACGSGGAGDGADTNVPGGAGSAASSTSPHSAPGGGVRFASVPVKVATRDAHGVFAARRTLLLPPGWSAQVWALVSGARFATWTPQGDLLVSSSAQGTITQLSPRNAAGAPPRQRTLISGLTWPQGMAFTKFKGHDVLYVAESDAVLRYRWEGGARWAALTSSPRD